MKTRNLLILSALILVVLGTYIGFYFLMERHPHFACETRFAELTVADLVSR